MAERTRSIRGRLVGEETAAVFENADFRRLYGGHAISKVGDELYVVAAMWLVYALTGSSLYTGLAGFLSRAPQAFGFLLGPIVDRSNLRRLLVSAETAQGLVVAVVPVAAVVGRLNVWIVLGVMPLLGVLKRVSDPAQNAAIPRLVADRHLVRANSLASTGDRAIGALAQAAAGSLVAAAGAVAVYALNAVTFAASAALFAALSIPPTEKSGSTPSAREYVADVREGAALVVRSVVGHMVVGAALAGAFTGMATAVLPAFADGLGGPATYGLLFASMTAGTLAGALAASRLEGVPLGRVTTVGFAAAAACWLGAVAVGPLPAVAVLFGLAFVPVGSYNVLVSATLQTGVPDSLLGRVTATAGSVTGLVGPLGLLAGGFLGDALGSETVVGASAIGFALIAAYWFAVPALRTLPAAESIRPGSFAPAGSAPDP